MEYSIQYLYDATVDLVTRIDDAEYKEWTELVDLRAKVLQQVSEQSAVSPEEKDLLRKIGEFDPVILEKMQQLKKEASNHIQKIMQSKRQKKMYQNDFVPGSFFVDKKK